MGSPVGALIRHVRLLCGNISEWRVGDEGGDTHVEREGEKETRLYCCIPAILSAVHAMRLCRRKQPS